MAYIRIVTWNGSKLRWKPAGDVRSDGSAPAYMLHTVSQQGMPHSVVGKNTTFSGMERYNGTLNQWLRSFF